MTLRLLAWTCLLLVLLSLPSRPEAQPASCAPQPTLKTTAVLTWAPPVQPVTVTTTGYEVWQQLGTGAWTKIADVGLSPAAYTVTNLTPGQIYTWGIKAVVKTTSGTDTGVSGYGTNDMTAPPCVAVLQVSTPTKVSATPQ